MEVSGLKSQVNQQVLNQENKVQNQYQRIQSVYARQKINQEKVKDQKEETIIKVTEEQPIDMIEKANKALLKPPMELQFSS